MSLRTIGGTLLSVAFPLTCLAFTWPTPSPGPDQGWAIERFIQPTVSGDPTSGLFGCVRNDGHRFHEGVDIMPFLERNRAGEATDPIRSAMDGRVVHVNAKSGLSSYGRYVVIEHDQLSPALLTLYAHLARIDPEIVPGARVNEGQLIGTMGRSASYRIPKDRTHLHFEIGLRMSDRFQQWYDRQGFGSKNDHGIYNGMNLTGFNALDCYRWVKTISGTEADDYVKSLPVGYVIEVAAPVVPDFVRRYPVLLSRSLEKLPLHAWRITFTPWGFPFRWEPISSDEAVGTRAGEVTVVAMDPGQVAEYECRSLIDIDGKVAVLNETGQSTLELLFGFE